MVDREKRDYTLIFDGGSLGNPGPGYGSYILVRNVDEKRRVKRLRFGDDMTSNEAEYRTLIAGLEDLLSTIRKAGRAPQQFSLEVRGDSRLILYQVARRWKTKKPHLMPLRGQDSPELPNPHGGATLGGRVQRVVSRPPYPCKSPSIHLLLSILS